MVPNYVLKYIQSPKVYGCGQWRYTYHGHEVIDHGGHNPGYHTQVGRLLSLSLLRLQIHRLLDSLMITSESLSFPTMNMPTVSSMLSGGELRMRFWNFQRLIGKIGQKMSGVSCEFTLLMERNRYLVKEAAKDLAKRKSYTPTPETPKQPSTAFERMTGSFSHPTYGDFNPCLVQSDLTAVSDDCQKLAHHPVVAKALNATASSVNEPLALVAPFSKFFVSYVVMRHFDGNLFNASFVWSNWDDREREGYSKNNEGSLITGIDDRFEVEWVETETENGFAFRGNFWGASGEAVNGIDGEMKGARGKDGAEVWFGRDKGF